MWWAPAEAIGAVWEGAAAGGWAGPEQAGAWLPVERSFRAGHPTTWWALAGGAGPYEPERGRRLVIATADPATLPETATWYLATTLPAAEADLTEIVRLYGLRNWVQQQDKQVKTSLGWSQYQVRSDVAMRRHWALVQGAFAFCWWAEMRTPVRLLAETWNDANILAALDELIAQLLPDPDKPRKREECAAGHALPFGGA